MVLLLSWYTTTLIQYDYTKANTREGGDDVDNQSRSMMSV
jgi:hypothetical protein